MAKPILQVIIASTRPERIGGAIGEWFVEEARKHGEFEVEVSDLRELDLPLMNEPKHPKMQDYKYDYTKKWSETIAHSDAIVFVMPEYNFGISAPLKNAIDYLFTEWNYKPVGFVSYGGVSAGLRAVQMAKEIVTTVKMIPIMEQVMIPWAPKFIEDGVFKPEDTVVESVPVMLDEILKMEKATAQLRK